MTERVVLAYSGGLDTSVAIGWIAEQTGAEVIAVADHGQVLAALADVDGDRDHLGAGLLGDPADGDRRVQAAGICEHYAFCHDISLVLVISGSPALLMVLAPARRSLPR